MEIETNGNELIVNGESVLLRYQLMSIFNQLKDASPKVITDNELMTSHSIMSRHTLNQNISMLRKSLSQFNGVKVVTHSKIGYALKITN